MGFDEKSAGDGSWWLLKVPVRLGKAWKEAAAGTVLGELDGSHLKVLEEGQQQAKSYDMVRQRDAGVPLRVFTKTGTTGRPNGDEPAGHFGLEPRHGIGYRRDLRTRMVESLQSSRMTQPLNDPEIPTTKISKNISFKKRDNATDDPDQPPSKRQRTQIDKRDAKTIVLGVLTKYQAEPMTIKEIKMALGEEVSQSMLKDVLEATCEKVKAEGRLTYHLKPEYRATTAMDVDDA